MKLRKKGEEPGGGGSVQLPSKGRGRQQQRRRAEAGKEEEIKWGKRKCSLLVVVVQRSVERECTVLLT